MQYQSSIILTYKGKILLFSRDILVETTEKISWDFLKMGKLKSKGMLDFLMNEISLSTKDRQDDQALTTITSDHNQTTQVFHFRLTDSNVNSMKRKEGWRLEFYRFNELDKIYLSDEARQILNNYNNEIKALLSI